MTRLLWPTCMYMYIPVEHKKMKFVKLCCRCRGWWIPLVNEYSPLEQCIHHPCTKTWQVSFISTCVQYVCFSCHFPCVLHACYMHVTCMQQSNIGLHFPEVLKDEWSSKHASQVHLLQHWSQMMLTTKKCLPCIRYLVGYDVTNPTGQVSLALVS